MTPEKHSEAIVHLQKLLAEQNALVQKLVGLLKPFADKVFDDNGDLTVTTSADAEHFIKAYYGVKKYG